MVDEQASAGVVIAEIPREVSAVVEEIKAVNDEAKSTVSEVQTGVCLSGLSSRGGMFANVVSNSGDYNLGSEEVVDTRPSQPQLLVSEEGRHDPLTVEGLDSRESCHGSLTGQSNIVMAEIQGRSLLWWR